MTQIMISVTIRITICNTKKYIDRYFGPKIETRDYLKAKVYIIWAHEPLELRRLVAVTRL